MACIFCRFLAWLQHKRRVRAQHKAAQAREAARAERNKRDRIASFDRRRRYEPPPAPLPPPGDTENLETLRARVPPRSWIVNEGEVFRPPWPTDTMEEACRVAARWVDYYISVAITEDERELVAARAVRAVATAVSTTPAYPVFIAAVTMAESMALIGAENPSRSHHYTKVPPGIIASRRLNALNAAVEAGMAAHAKDIAHTEDIAHHKDNARRPDDDEDGSDLPSDIDTDITSEYTLVSDGTHAAQPNPDPHQNPDAYLDSQPLLNYSYSTQYFENNRNPGLSRQMLVSRPSTSRVTSQWPG